MFKLSYCFNDSEFHRKSRNCLDLYINAIPKNQFVNFFSGKLDIEV